MEKAPKGKNYEKGLTDRFPFTTLLKNDIKKGWYNTWYPVPVETYRDILKIDISTEKGAGLLNNICYNLQYLEFLEKEFAELEVSSVIYVMLVKSYVLAGSSIVEGLFSSLIRQKGWTLNPETMKERHIRKGSYEEKIAIIEEQCMKNNIDASSIPYIDMLRKLRNRIHLQISKNITDHDYNAFDRNVKTETGRLIYQILTSDEFSKDPECFSFLKVNVMQNSQK